MFKFGASVNTAGGNGFFCKFSVSENEFVCGHQQRLRVQCGKAVTGMAFTVKNMEEIDH